MLTEIYIEALLVDEELADQVWEAWDAAKIDDVSACLACLLIANMCTANVYKKPLITPSNYWFEG